MLSAIRKLAPGLILIAAASAVLLFSDLKNRGAGASGQASDHLDSPGTASGPKRVFVVRYVDATYAERVEKGIRAGLRESGLTEGRDFDLTFKSAQGDIATLNSIMDMAKTERADLVIAISTPALQAALRRFEKTPVVFTAIASAIVAGAARTPTDHRPNVTGVEAPSAYLEMAAVLKECMPRARRVGTVFLPSEANCVFNTKQTRRRLRGVGVELVTVPAYTATEIGEAAHALCAKDITALCQVTSNLIASSFAGVRKAADQARLPIFAFTSGLAREGAAIVVARDYFDAGREGALVAARILRGENPAGIPIRAMKTTRVIINLRKARKLGLNVPPSLLKRAAKIID